MSIEIIVDTYQEKLDLLEGSEIIHDFQELNTDIPGCNTLAHIYHNPDIIKVRNESEVK